MVHISLQASTVALLLQVEKQVDAHIRITPDKSHIQQAK